jgi:hypothetical protein
MSKKVRQREVHDSFAQPHIVFGPFCMQNHQAYHVKVHATGYIDSLYM